MTTPFNRNIKALREREHKTQHQFAEILDIDHQTPGRWERYEIYKPRSKEIIDKIKETFNVTDTDLFGFSDGLYAQIYGLANMKDVRPSESYAPLIGTIAAGDAREVYENPDDWIWIPPEILEYDPDVFYLRVSGDSMDETEFTGDTYAAISPKSEVRNGDIAAVKVNGDEATLKVYKKYDDVIYLEPRSSNPEHKRRIIDSSDPDAPNVRVLGKAVWSYRKPKF